MFFFFFFQAEDGIRDKLVTGVQTCALPICHGVASLRLRVGRCRSGHATLCRDAGVSPWHIARVFWGAGGGVQRLRRVRARELAPLNLGGLAPTHPRGCGTEVAEYLSPLAVFFPSR